VAVGGAAISRRTLEAAAEVGLPVYEGYGLSECASVVALNRPSAKRLGSVGRPLPHVQINLAQDGEILVQGLQWPGYLGEPARTPIESIATGDIGHLDADGYLYVTGRKKDVFITSFGRNISPEWIEKELVAQAPIAQAALFGDGLPFNSAVIVPCPGTAASAVDDALAAVNLQLPDYARVRSWVPARNAFSLGNGMLTANGRLRRAPIRDAHLDLLAAVYRDSSRSSAAIGNDAFRPTLERQMDFYTELQEATSFERTSLQSLPIVAAALAGNVTREQYLAFLERAFHHVKHTPSLLMACGARLPLEKDWLRAALAHYIGEEVGHHDWILNDIEAAGGDAAAVRTSEPNFETEQMVAYAYDTIARGNPVGFLGMVYVLEGTSVALAQRVAESLQRGFGLPAAAFSYLTSHGALDTEHIGHFARIVNRLDMADDRACLRQCAKNFFRLYADVLVSIDAAAIA
jgi:pyrroloquinoline quinone (PQQ) biosynthesis protein C